MKSSKELAKWHLLNGDHINKGDFHQKYHTFTLTQRINEIRDDGWDVQSKTIPGKNGMVEYWLEPEEIERIKGRKQADEQSFTGQQNHAQKPSKSAQNAEYEQLGIGLLGGRNYG